MSDRGWISIAIAFHLTAITLAALPQPVEVNPVDEIRRPATGGLARLLTPVFDRLATGVAAAEPRIYRLSAPLRVLTQPYVNAGLRQKWNMFANPGLFDTYLRVDYLSSAAGSTLPTERAQQLVFPAAREDRPRWRHEFRDKAVFSAIENYLVAEQKASSASDVSRTPAEIRPVARYFGQTFASTLEAGRDLVRVEVWYGTAPIPPPGDVLDPQLLSARLQALEKYRAPQWQTTRAAVASPPAREADITWTLIYAGSD